jgi:hypothetical protein
MPARINAEWVFLLLLLLKFRSLLFFDHFQSGPQALVDILRTAGQTMASGDQAQDQGLS